MERQKGLWNYMKGFDCTMTKRKIWTIIKQTQSFITFAYYWGARRKINNIKRKVWSHWSDIPWRNRTVTGKVREGLVTEVLASEWHLERLRQSSSESSNLNRRMTSTQVVSHYQLQSFSGTHSHSIKVDKCSVTSFWKASYSKVSMVQNCPQCYKHNFRSCNF